MTIGRRGFLRFLASAPVAAPVVAREAAQKAGIGVLGLAGPGIAPAPGFGGDEEKKWAAGWAKEAFSAAWAERQRRNILREPVTSLDPDLASSRSLSLSAAVRMQKERNFERSIASNKEAAAARYLAMFGVPYVG